MGLFSNKLQRQRMRFFHLFMLASVEGINERERLKLIEMGRRCELSGAEMSKIINNPSAVDMAPPKTLDEGIKQLLELVELMMCDDEITESEYLYVLKICPELNIPANSAELVLNTVINDAINVRQHAQLERHDLLVNQVHQIIATHG